jgi:protein-export membrane protein SecD
MQTWKTKKKVVKKSPQAWKLKSVAVLMIIATFTSFAFDFPGFYNQASSFVKAKTNVSIGQMVDEPFRLGLDLQGGTHLVYEADMKEILEADRLEALEGVRDVIERRVNAFGVSEPVVQTTSTGGTYRVIVELAGVLNVSDAISQIGETPVLEFKKPGQELERDPTAEERAELNKVNKEERAEARKVLARARANEDFDALVQEFSTEKGKGQSKGVLENILLEGANSEYSKLVRNMGLKDGQVYWDVLETGDSINIFKALEKTSTEEMLLSHVLVCFEGKAGCNNPISQLDASLQINNLKDEATAQNFAELAKVNSTDPSAATNSGDLGWATGNKYVPAFALAAAKINKGEFSDIVETDFGYHLIYKEDTRQIPAYSIQRIQMPFSNIYDVVPESSPWVNTELSGKHLERAGVEFDQQSGVPHVGLTFDSEGGDLFGEITAANVGKPIAIFLDGSPISTPTVQTAIYGGRAVITGNFALDEAKLLSQRLNAGALPVPVELLSQQTVGPTLGAESMQKSILAALAGFLLVALYMILLYRVPGLVAVVALFLFAFLNLLAYRTFGVTITLAGIAGFVLSLGIAVDANVLIIERLKEELKSGRDFASATDEAFKRAWTAIRDGNITTLIAAGVLYWFSSSFIRGFALTLSIGVILSMFTAISVTRVYLKVVLNWKPVRKLFLFGVKRND